MDDNRIPVKWGKKISLKNLAELWVLAYYAIKDAGKGYLLKDMNECIAKSKSQQDTLDIIQRFVRFE